MNEHKTLFLALTVKLLTYFFWPFLKNICMALHRMHH